MAGQKSDHDLIMTIFIQLGIFVLGLLLVFVTIASALQTFVLPRGSADFITNAVFRLVRGCFDLLLKRTKNFTTRDRFMALYAPVSVLVLLPVWLILVSIGYAAMFWATGIETFREAFTVSGSSLLTLGFAKGDTVLHTVLAFSEATIGLILVALLIAYLPTMYNAFSAREIAVNLLAVRAGSPPLAPEMLLRYHRIGQLEEINETWEKWERWFAELEESHTSLSPLVFFRSPNPEQSWVTASGAVLDAAALYLSSLELPPSPEAMLCIRAGYLSLRRIADLFRIPFEKAPLYPDSPISITYAEFEMALKSFADQGIPIKENIGQAWQDFAGWRVNYDSVLIDLCELTMAPMATWSGDPVIE